MAYYKMLKKQIAFSDLIDLRARKNRKMFLKLFSSNLAQSNLMYASNVLDAEIIKIEIGSYFSLNDSTNKRTNANCQRSC